MRFEDLRGRAALVTGGASGIGAAIVRGLVGQGARVGVLDLDAEAGLALARELGAAVVFEATDLRDIEALRRAVDKVRAALGPITLLVNNAARDDRHRIEEVTPHYWRERMATNIDHQFFAAQAVVPDMRAAGGGSIVCLGSTSYLASHDSFAAYKTAKSAVVGLMRALARELGADGVRVNCLLPGWIMTERQIELWLTPESEKELLARQCVKRKLTPDDMVGPTLFLLSGASAAMTAQTMIVDGGWT
ncbi:MAG: SDR family oxidoreductase [Methylobacteriaceae bacterium]|nr:SDR family oxidoreductase [Methylobacteriaceae bacterium]